MIFNEIMIQKNLETRSISVPLIFSRTNVFVKISLVRKVSSFFRRKTMEKVYNKLVRDNIPEIIINNGGEPIYRELNNEEYWQYLLEKDKEELLEVEKANSLEERKKELADKLELIRAMASFNGFTLNDIIEEADKKKTKNGGFEKKLLLVKVIEK